LNVYLNVYLKLNLYFILDIIIARTVSMHLKETQSVWVKMAF